jgi:hypothetical protein
LLLPVFATGAAVKKFGQMIRKAGGKRMAFFVRFFTSFNRVKKEERKNPFVQRKGVTREAKRCKDNGGRICTKPSGTIECDGQRAFPKGQVKKS